MVRKTTARSRAKPSTIPKTHLVIPDSHCAPDDLNLRYIRLAKLICDIKPDKIIHLGDWGDFISLNQFDNSKTRAKFCGRSYKQDVDAVNRSLDMIQSTVMKTRWGKQKWKTVDKHVTLGNHEHRLERFIDYNGEFEGVIDLTDIKWKEHYWKTHPYQQQLNLNGIIYSHNVAYQMAHRPISGVHHAHTLMSKWHSSITVGHSHLLDYKMHTDIVSGRKLHGLVGGCFLELDQWEDYAGESQKLWWKGLIVKKNVIQGDYDPQFISMRTLVDEYTV